MTDKQQTGQYAPDGSLYITLTDGSGNLTTVGGGGGGSGTVTTVSVATVNGVSGSVANPTTTPAISLTLGAITPTTVNGNTLTTGTGTLTLGAGKTATISNTLTFTGTDGSSVAFGAGGTNAYTSNKLSSFASTSSSELAGVISDETGSGALVFATSPTLVTPALGTPASGVATNLTGTAAGLIAGTVTTNANLTGVITSSGNATSIASQTGTGTKFVVDTSPTLVTPVLGVATATSLNGNTFTTGTYTLTGTAGKTLTFSNSLTLSGTDATTMTFPTTTATIARTDAGQTFTGTQTFGTISSSTISVGGNLAFTTNGGVINLRSSTTILSSPAAAALQHGAVDAASPVAQTISFQSVAAGNANTAGANATIQGSLSNGSGGGDILIKTTLSNASSGVQNTAATAITFKGGTQLTQFSAPAVLASYTVSGLPSASTSGAGATAFVTDASTTLVLGLGGTVTGGGSNKVPVFSDGTNWVYG